MALNPCALAMADQRCSQLLFLSYGDLMPDPSEVFLKLLADRCTVSELADGLNEYREKPAWNTRRPALSRPEGANPEEGVAWDGAGIFVAFWPLPDYQGSKIVAVTPHAFALSMLLERLRVGLESLTAANEREFYRVIANKLVEQGPAPRSRIEAFHTVLSAADDVLWDWTREAHCLLPRLSDLLAERIDFDDQWVDLE